MVYGDPDREHARMLKEKREANAQAMKKEKEQTTQIRWQCRVGFHGWTVWGLPTLDDVTQKRMCVHCYRVQVAIPIFKDTSTYLKG